MRLVPRADARPNQCVVLPHLPHDHVRGFIDTGNQLTAVDPRIFVSVVAVEEMNKLLGFPTPQEHAEAVSERDELRLKVEHLEADLEEAQRLVQAIDAIESAGFRARKKAGRPKQEVA